jgi:hypothetical protein
MWPCPYLFSHGLLNEKHTGAYSIRVTSRIYNYSSLCYIPTRHPETIPEMLRQLAVPGTVGTPLTVMEPLVWSVYETNHPPKFISIYGAH